MEFTQEERNEFTKNLISGVESSFCKIDPLKTKKSKLELQNKIAYDLRGVPNWMAKPFLKYTTFFGGLFYLFFHALTTMVHSKTDFQALLVLLPIMLIVPTFLVFTAISGYADELPNAEKAGFIPANEAKNIVYQEMLKIGVNNINRKHFEKLVKRLAFLVMCGEDPFDVFKNDDSLNTVNQQIETLQKFDQSNIALGVLVAKRDRLLERW